MTVYIQRENGVITGIFAFPQSAINVEETGDNDPAVIAFLNPPTASVSARQFKLQLVALGILNEVDAWVKTQSQAVQIAFEYSGSFVKSEPMMQLGFTAMGFTDQQIDDFFTAASRL